MSGFDISYQKYFAAHYLRDSQFAMQVNSDLTPETFTDETLSRLIRVGKNYYSQHRAAPGEIILQFLRDMKATGAIAEVLCGSMIAVAEELLKVPLQNRQYLLSRFDEWALSQSMTSTALPAMELIKKGQTKEAAELLKQIFIRRNVRSGNLGRFYTTSADDRIDRREEMAGNLFWTLIPEIDRRIDGLGPSEIGLISSARSSGGKSAFLAFLTRSAIMQAKKVLIYSLEMTEENYEDRLDQCLVGLTRRELKDSARINARLQKMLRSDQQVFIKKFPPHRTRISDLRDHKDTIAAMYGFVPDVLLLDYVDLVAPETASLRGDLHALGAEVMSALSCWVDDDKIPCWTASQSGRGAGDEKVTADQQHIAGSIAKPQIAHIHLTLNRTPEEENRGVLRFYVAKAREAKARYEISVRSDFSRMQIALLPDSMRDTITPQEVGQ